MFKRSIISVLFIIFCAGAMSLTAQTDKQPADTAKVNNILYLLKISGTADFAYLIVDDVIKNYQQYVKNTPNGYWDKVVQETNIKPFLDSIVTVYEKRFSNDEIKELIKFFESSVGNKWAIELKTMNDEVMTQANIFGQNLFNEINKRLMKEGFMNTPETEPDNSNQNNNDKNKQKNR